MEKEKIGNGFKILYIISSIILCFDIYIMISLINESNIMSYALTVLSMFSYYFLFCILFVITTILFILEYKNKDAIRKKISIMYIILFIVGSIFTYFIINPSKTITEHNNKKQQEQTERLGNLVATVEYTKDEKIKIKYEKGYENYIEIPDNFFKGIDFIIPDDKYALEETVIFKNPNLNNVTFKMKLDLNNLTEEDKEYLELVNIITYNPNGAGNEKLLDFKKGRFIGNLYNSQNNKEGFIELSVNPTSKTYSASLAGKLKWKFYVKEEENKIDSDNVILNERQREILKSADLSTNYKDLTYNQKDAITRMEIMFKYLDKKYKDITFYYKGYVSRYNKEDFEKEHLIVSIDNVNTCNVTVEKDGLNDDCAELLVSGDFKKYISKYFEDNNLNVKVFSQITNVNDFTRNKGFDNNVESRNDIYIDIKDLNEEQDSTDSYISNICEKYKKWLREHKLFSTNQIVLVKSDNYSKIDNNNYKNILRENKYVANKYCNNY